MVNIEELVINYLNDNGIDAYIQMPETVSNPNPGSMAEFVIVQKTGSGWVNRLCEATIAIQSYAPTLYRASQLNYQIIDLMQGIISLEEVTSCKLNSDYEFTDTTNKRPRYQAVFDIKHYQE